MRRTWEWLGLNLGKRAGTVAICGLLLTLALGFGITKLRFTTSNSDYLNNNDPAWINNVNYEKVFGGDPMAVLFTMKPGTTVDNLLTKHNQAEFRTIAAPAGQRPLGVQRRHPDGRAPVRAEAAEQPHRQSSRQPRRSILLQSAISRDHHPADKQIRAHYLTQEGIDLAKTPPADQVLSNPKWMHFVIHEQDGTVRQSLLTFVHDDHHALLAVYLKGDLNINQETTAASSVAKIIDSAHFQNVTTITTGVPALLKTINDYLKHGIIVLALLAGVIMMTILLLSFTVRWRLLAFAIVAVGLVWGFGLVGYFGVPLTLATIAALPVLLGVGMDYAIQMHSRIEEEVVLDRAAHPIQAAARGLGPALLVVTFDAVFAFMALWFAKTPAIREFGSLLVIGIIAVCVCSIIATLAVLGIREYKSPTKGKDFSQGRLSRVVVFLGSLPQRTAVPLAIVSVVILLSGIAVEGKLALQTDPISWVNPHSQAIKDIKQLKAATGLRQRDRHADLDQPPLEQPDRRLRRQLLAPAREEVPRRLVPRRRSHQHHRPIRHGQGHEGDPAHRGRDAGHLPHRAARHQQDDGGRQRGGAQRHLPGADRHPRPAPAGGEGPPRRDQPAAGDHRRARRHRHGGRGPHPEPREVPGAAHLPGHPLRGRSSSRCGCAASSGRCCRSCRCSWPWERCRSSAWPSTSS